MREEKQSSEMLRLGGGGFWEGGLGAAEKVGEGVYDRRGGMEGGCMRRGKRERKRKRKRRKGSERQRLLMRWRVWGSFG